MEMAKPLMNFWFRLKWEISLDVQGFKITISYGWLGGQLPELSCGCLVRTGLIISRIVMDLIKGGLEWRWPSLYGISGSKLNCSGKSL